MPDSVVLLIFSPLSVVAFLNALLSWTTVRSDHFENAGVLVSFALKLEMVDVAGSVPALHDPLARVVVDEVLVPALATNLALVADLEWSWVIPLEDYSISSG